MEIIVSFVAYLEKCQICNKNADKVLRKHNLEYNRN